MAVSKNWEQVAQAVKRARGEAGYANQEEAADAAGVGVQVWREIEGNKKNGNHTLPILAGVARAFSWPPDMLERIAAGEPPPPARKAQSEDPAIAERVARLELVVLDQQAELARLRQRVGEES